jgi:beta-galactosidase
MKSEFVQQLQPAKSGEVKPGEFFKGTFTLTNTGDTYLDMSNFRKGMVWVNGHNLGRYWEIGPQKRLYCPAPWLKKGENEMIVLDQHQVEAATVKGEKTLE